MDKDFRSKIASGVFWSVTQAWSHQVIALAVFVCLARLLAPEDFGVVAIAMVLITILSLFVEQGFATSIIQRKNLEAGHLNAAFWMNLGSGLLFALIAVLLARPIASFYDSPELVWVIRLLSLNLILGALTEVQKALLSRNFKFRMLAIRTLISTAVGGVVGLLFAFRGYGVYSLVAQQLATSVAALITLWTTTAWMPGLVMSRRHVSDLWSFGSKVFGSSLLNMIRKRSDVVVISIFFGPVVVGYYTVAMKPISMLVAMFTKVVCSVSLPAFSELQSSPERLSKALSFALKIVGIFFLPAVVFMVFHGEFVILLLFGETWAPSASLLGVLVFWGLAQAVLVLFAQAIVAKGRPGLVMILTGSLAVACPIAMLAVVPLGVYAVAIANVVLHFLVAVAFFLVINRTIGLSGKVLLSDLRSPIVAAVGLVAISISFNALLPDELKVVAGLFFGIGAYITLVFVVERQSPLQLFKQVRVYFSGKRVVAEIGRQY